MILLTRISIVLYLCLQNSFDSVNAIRCFQCNSVNNSGCVTLENYKRNYFYPTMCLDEGPSKAFCRKTVIQVLEKGKHHDPRVIRSCGYIAHKNPCYRTDNEGHTEQVCQCFEDGCNTAAKAVSSIYGILFVIISAAILNILTIQYV